MDLYFGEGMLSGMNNLDMSVNIAGVKWKNPITTASGTFSVRESGAFYDLSELGALTTKGVSYEEWEGTATPRIAETYGGMLNSIGLQNKGIELFIEEELPLLKKYDTPIIVNVVGKTIEEYCRVVERLSETDIDMLELNISCPNIKEGGISFGTEPKMAFSLVEKVRKITKKALIVKLSPNVTDITEIARSVEAAGADCLSLINTLLGMRIDVAKRKAVLANRVGGLSGPAIKPVALRMVYEVRRAVNLPIIGMGDIMTGEDAVEFLMAGADAISVGTASLIDPTAPLRIKNELREFMLEYNYKSIKEIELLEE
jgi:dihydroorotate dehydrogenase (NAD+) catalytic subunit